MEEEPSHLGEWKKKLIYGLAGAGALLALIIVGMSLAELYSDVNPLLAKSLTLVTADSNACFQNASLAAKRPIYFVSVTNPDQSILCGWTSGPTALRCITAILVLVATLGCLANMLRIKSARVQLILSGGAAVVAALLFISLVVDADKVSTAADYDLCVTGVSPLTGDAEYVCHAGRFIAVVLMDVIAFALLAALAVLSFFYVRRGQFAIEVQADSSVDYFGEAERYFPGDGDADDKSSLYE